MIVDIMQQPFATTLGLFGWPHPSEALTLWRDRVIAEGRIPTPAAVEGMKGRVLTNMRTSFPILSRWAESMDWLQGLGRGDLVGILDLRSGNVISHTCLSGREDYRDDTGLLWNWQWVISAPDVHAPKMLHDTYADASGAILDRRSRPTMKALVRPELNAGDARAVTEEWHGIIAPLLAQRPAVRTWQVEYAPLDEKVFADECRKILEAP